MKVATSRERIIELLEMSGDTQADMVRKTGIDKSAISHYINGKRVARQDKLIAIANAYNVNPSWLMGLDVPMTIEQTMLEMLLKHDGKEIRSEIEVKDDQSEMFRALELYSHYRQAIPEIREAVDRLLKTSQSDT